MEIVDARLRLAAWAGGTITTNPAINTVLADGLARAEAPTPDGVEYDYLVVISASAAADVSIEHRNAANGANVEVVTHILPASLIALLIQVRLAQNERLRVIMAAALTGRISASLHKIRAHD